ncbi:S1 family peptidase [Bdellovibrio reynosensis]|uniref:Trypsin-like serine protease n=1 Tax=Bdellovibrio reynosensis TaxID=2835041 RepID=A0ABY4CFP7_9BACT|nr:trypsin-like serine protease [Bdellovibrio reynosensis]UOF02368.1 trypsin-like serine protease [Bdellovibrio reynosensis]
MTSSAIKISMTLVFASLLAACAERSQNAMGLNAEAANAPKCQAEASIRNGIVGGSVLTDGDLSSSTVLLITELDDGTSSICTGTLIAENKVLTAAHCIKKTSKKMYASFVKNSACINSLKTLREVTHKALKTDHDFTQSVPIDKAQDDLAVVRFEGKAPKGTTIRPLPGEQFTATEGEELVMAGYGTTGMANADGGLLRHVTVPGKQLVKSFYDPRNKDYFAVLNTHIVLQPEKGVCVGDSGGPLYVKTYEGLVLYGITSMGFNPDSEDSTKTCNGISLFADVRHHLDWINKQLKEL